MPMNQPDYRDIPTSFPPIWANAYGQDSYGLWADLCVKEITQRMRWIPKGVFSMGSPKTEKERSANEDLHEVTLLQGCWLADTACTQELWLALMGENPADFKDDLQNPVETVSWLDVQKFLKILQGLASGVQPRLPTEAEWEYACRAGTETPFSFGESIHSGQVNFDVTEPYAGAEKSEYRQKTIAVKSLPVNPWGLYEMHGNVWEWCSDEYQHDLGSKPVTDPLTAESPESLARSDAGRVLRGGSWFYYGQDCRSAGRNGNSADLRYRDYGFRFALGNELQTSQALGAGRKKKRAGRSINSPSRSRADY